MFKATVRYGRLRHLAEFEPDEEMPEPPRGPAVVRTERGLELGQVLLVGPPSSIVRASRRKFIRAATPEDLATKQAGSVVEAKALAFAQPRAKGARIVGCELVLSGERLIVYYTTDDKLDLRDLARSLQVQTGTRVELRQLGARERARACGGTAVCGRTLCCSTFLRQLEPVTMRMAKVQGLSLAPEATSGACGRLKCCLRYENPLYEEGRAFLPRVGARVEARRASGEVVAVDALARKVTVKTDDGPSGVRHVTLFFAEVAHGRTVEPPLATPPAEPSAERPSRWKGLTARLGWLSSRLRRPDTLSPSSHSSEEDQGEEEAVS